MWTKINVGSIMKDYKSYSHRGLIAKIISINELMETVKVQVKDEGKSEHFKEGDIITLNFHVIDEYYEIVNNTIKKL